MATLDILTDEEAAGALERGQADLTPAVLEAIQLVNTAVSLRLDRLIGCAVVRPVAEKVRTHGARAELRCWPVVDVTSVVEWGVTLDPALYVVDEQWGVLWRQVGGFDVAWRCGRDRLAVEYTAGHAATTAEVPASIKLAAQICVRHVWEQDHTLGAAMVDQAISITTPRSFSIPRRALDLVRDLIKPQGLA